MLCCGTEVADTPAAPAAKSTQVATLPTTIAAVPTSPAQSPAQATMAGDMLLEPHPTIPKHDGPVLVCILDGYGENEFQDSFNAVASAVTPIVDSLRAVPGRFRTVRAHGTAVGLPSDADMGNSEVSVSALPACVVSCLPRIITTSANIDVVQPLS